MKSFVYMESVIFEIWTNTCVRTLRILQQAGKHKMKNRLDLRLKTGYYSVCLYGEHTTTRIFRLGILWDQHTKQRSWWTFDVVHAKTTAHLAYSSPVFGPCLGLFWYQSKFLIFLHIVPCTELFLRCKNTFWGHGFGELGNRFLRDCFAWQN